MFLNFRWHRLHSTGFGSVWEVDLLEVATVPGEDEFPGDGLPFPTFPFPGEPTCCCCCCCCCACCCACCCCCYKQKTNPLLICKESFKKMFKFKKMFNIYYYKVSQKSRNRSASDLKNILFDAFKTNLFFIYKNLHGNCNYFMLNNKWFKELQHMSHIITDVLNLVYFYKREKGVYKIFAT